MYLLWPRQALLYTRQVQAGRRPRRRSVPHPCWLLPLSATSSDDSLVNFKLGALGGLTETAGEGTGLYLSGISLNLTSRYYQPRPLLSWAGRVALSLLPLYLSTNLPWRPIFLSIWPSFVIDSVIDSARPLLFLDKANDTHNIDNSHGDIALALLLAIVPDLTNRVGPR